MPMRPPKDGAKAPPPAPATVTSPPRSASKPKTASSPTTRTPAATTSGLAPSSGSTVSAAGSTAPAAASSPASSAAASKNKNSPKDRIFAVFCVYEPQKVQHVETVFQKLGGDAAKTDSFIAEYLKKQGSGATEPESKTAALRSFFTKHFNGDKKQIDQAMDLMKQIPGHEAEAVTQFVAENAKSGADAGKAAAAAAKPPVAGAASPSSPAAGAKAPATVAAAAKTAPAAASPVGKKAPAPAGATLASPTASGLPATTSGASSLGAASPAGGAAVGASRAVSGLPFPNGMESPAPSGVVGGATLSPRSFASAGKPAPAELQAAPLLLPQAMKPAAPLLPPPRPKSTCDRAVRDRVVAMLAAYDPDSLLQLDEDADIPTTEVGAAFLNSLAEQHGPEPPSKRAAIEALLQRLFEKQDPQRMRSVKTLVCAAEAAPGKDLQIVRSMFQAYGLGHAVGRSVASLGLAPASSTSMVSFMASPMAAAAGSPSSSASPNGSPKGISFGGGAAGASGAAPTMTTTSILAAFSPLLPGMSSSSAWSPERSVAAQRGLFAASPRRLPLNTKNDLLSQLSGAPQVRPLSAADPPADFSDLLVVDTHLGEQSIAGAGGVGGAAAAADVIESGMQGHNPFLRAARGEVFRAGDNDDDGEDESAAAENPFLRPGQMTAFKPGTAPRFIAAPEPPNSVGGTRKVKAPAAEAAGAAVAAVAAPMSTPVKQTIPAGLSDYGMVDNL